MAIASSQTVSANSVSTRVVAALLAVWVIWGSTYLAIRYGLETIDPFVLQFGRFAIAAPVLWLIVRRSTPRPSGRQVRNASMIGVLLLIGGVGMVTVAEDRGLESGVAATIIAVQPMLASVWGGFFGRWPQRIEWVGMTIGLAGVAVLSASGSLSGSRSAIAIVFFACVNWSLGSIVSRHIDMPEGAMATVVEMGAASLGFAVLAALTGAALDVPSGRSLAAMLYLAILGSLVAFSAFVYLVHNVRPSLALSYAYVNPIIAVVLGALLYDEPLTTNLVVALPITVVGVAIVTLARARAQPAGSGPETERPPETAT